MTKKPPPHGENLVARKVAWLREGNARAGPFIGETPTQEAVAKAVREVISGLMPPDTAVMRRRVIAESKGIQFFRREDVSKIENGTRAVRDYELFALAKVFGTTIQDLFTMPEDQS